MQPQDSIFGYALTYVIQHYEKFKELPPPTQATFIRQAQQLESLPGSHFKSPEELVKELGGSVDNWRNFILWKPVADWINKRVQEDMDILNRQALFKQAEKAVKSSDNASAKYLAALAELNSAQTNQRTIVLHYIGRPESDESSVPVTD